MTRLDPTARVHVTQDGAEFNRSALQFLHIGTTPTGPSFFNTATGMHTQVIPRAVVVTTAATRVYQEPTAPRGIVRCASDNANQPAPYFADPIDDLCLICSMRDNACVVTTPVVIVSREGSGWRVLRLDVTGKNAQRAREWEQRFYLDWDLEHEADVSISLDVQCNVQLPLGLPRRIDRRQAPAPLALSDLLHVLPLPAAMMKAVRP